MTLNVLEATPAAQTKASMFQIEYYQQFFNIDTMEVVDRLASSMIPKRAPPTYLKTHLVRSSNGVSRYLETHAYLSQGVNPDLYGPFWITVTLIFTIGISGNLAKFFQHDHSSDFQWHYNFHLVSYASTCIIMYVCVMPIAIWSVLKWSVNLSDDTNLDLESVSCCRSCWLLVSDESFRLRLLTFPACCRLFASTDIHWPFMFPCQSCGPFRFELSLLQSSVKAFHCQFNRFRSFNGFWC